MKKIKISKSFSQRCASYIAGFFTGLSLCALLIVIEAMPELKEIVSKYQVLLAAMIAFVIAFANRAMAEDKKEQAGS